MVFIIDSPEGGTNAAASVVFVDLLGSRGWCAGGMGQGPYFIVQALDWCISIIDLFIREWKPLGVTGVAAEVEGSQQVSLFFQQRERNCIGVRLIV
jgi:hypothetical protein